MTNLFVTFGEGEGVEPIRNSIAEMLKDAGVDYLDLRAEDATIPKLQPRDGPNWLLVNQFPEDLQGASTVWIGEGNPAEAATYNIDTTDKTVTQVIAEVNGLVQKQDDQEISPDEPEPLYAVWSEPTDEGMLALTSAGELVLTQQPTVDHPDPLMKKDILRKWMERLQRALDVPDANDEAKPHVEDHADLSPAPAVLKYLNRRGAQDTQEEKE